MEHERSHLAVEAVILKEGAQMMIQDRGQVRMAEAGITLRMVKIQRRSQLFGHEGLHSKHGLSNRLTRQWALIQLNMLLSVNQQHSILSFQMLALSKWMNLCLLSYKL